MAPRKPKKGKVASRPSKAASDAAAAASAFAATADPSDQAFLQALEEDVKVKEDNVVDEQVGCSFQS
jgi:hypothetical protein